MHNIPKLVRRGAVAILAICALYQFLLAYSPWKAALIHTWWGDSIWIPVIAVLAWTGFRINYIRRKVKAADGLACLECLYCLRGLEPCGKCPECGTPYDISVVVPTWTRVLRNAPF